MSDTFLAPADLFDRLAGADAAGVTVLTPNLRLAKELQRAFDAHQLARGLSAWAAADILPWTAWVQRAYEDFLHSASGAQLPQLLTPAQEQALWEDIVRGWEGGEALLAVPEAAASARQAWDLAHAWGLMPALQRAAPNEDAQAWAEWARRYERDTRRAGGTDAARLPDLLLAQFADPAAQAGAGLPRLLVAYGFDIVTPQQRALFDALAARGCAHARSAAARAPESAPLRLACVDARDEIGRAAAWARARLEAAQAQGRSARIGVVVPDLAMHRNALRRAFTRTMAPTRQVPREAHALPPFNISLGEPLNDWPLVDTAFAILELAGRELPYERASLVIRSPYLAQADAEMTRRARLDAALRERAEPVLGLDRLLALLVRASMPRAAVLAQRLAQFAELRRERLFAVQSPGAWARAFGDALALLGFPGERSLSSEEFQTLARWQALLAQFAQLERVAPRMGYAQALARLRRMAADTAFQPEAHEEPVQILGVLESAGVAFDHLWVMGLCDEAWPLAARANPFLPIALQRAAGIPEASAEAALALDRRITAGWLTAAAEVVLSHPCRDGDRDLQPSPLIAHLAEGGLALPTAQDWGAQVHAARAALESLPDEDAPSLAEVRSMAQAIAPDAAHEYASIEAAIEASSEAAIEAPHDAQAGARVAEHDGAAAVRGGTQVLKDQAACPFRAFAVHRLDAAALATPHAGLDAMERGSLVHQVLATAWRELETKHALDTLAPPALEQLLQRAAAEAVARMRRDRPETLSGRFAAVEQRRLVRLASEWLELERQREPFSVFAVEDPRNLEIGGLRMRGRLDRVDETAQGERIVIDYKTGKPAAGDWLGPRMDEPQLPLYLVASEPDAQALAFAQVKAGAMQFVSLAADKGLLPGARALPDGRLKRAAQSWEAQLADWRAALERLARGYAGGAAAVDPKPGACEYCDQQPLCRIHERRAWSASGEDEAGSYE